MPVNKIIEDNIIIDKELFNKYNNDEKIVLKNNKSISVTLLKEILSNDNYYKYVSEMYKDRPRFNIYYKINGDYKRYISLSLIDILNSIRKLIVKTHLNMTSTMYERYNTLRYETSQEAFDKKYEKEKQKLIVEGKKVVIKVPYFKEFLHLKSFEYDNFLKGISKKTPYTKEEFIYSLTSFFIDNDILNRYDFDEKILTKINDFINSKDIDIEAINKVLKTDSLPKVSISNSLKQEILKDIPKSYKKLDIATYIYIKLCKILSYDEEYLVNNQRGSVLDKHVKIDNIKNITKENNNAVCYEFSLIYAKLLEELGIDFNVPPFVFQSKKEFSLSHSYLIFKVDKYLVKADSVTSILNGDMVNAKILNPLVGINCINKNEKTREEFTSVKEKVYKTINKQEKSDMKFYKKLDEYKNNYQKDINISLMERYDIFLKSINESNLVGVDNLGYITNLKRILFTKEEQDNKLNVTFVKNNETDKSSIIVVFNEESLKNVDTNIYYYSNVSQSKGLHLTTKEELTSYFKDKILEYIDENDEDIPGVNKGVKHVK